MYGLFLTSCSIQTLQTAPEEPDFSTNIVGLGIEEGTSQEVRGGMNLLSSSLMLY